MTCNIWLPILVNLLIVGVVALGVLIGKKNGFKYEIIKLLTVCAACVGLYFLNPVVADVICNIEAVSAAIAAGAITVAIIKSLTFLGLFLLTYLLITGIFGIVRLSRELNQTSGIVNTAKRLKPVGVTKKETRRLRREQRRTLRRQKIEAALKIKIDEKGKHKLSKVFGAIIGGIFGVIFAFALTLPLKPTFDKLAEDPSVEAIQTGYEYTAFGQLDKATDIVNKVLR